MEHNEILKNAFNLLAISTSVATFLPALIYSNLIKFADELYMKSKEKEFTIAINDSDENPVRIANRKWVSKYVAYSVSLDIIQFTMMILVVATAICNFILYISSIVTNPCISRCLISFLWAMFLVGIIYLWRKAYNMVNKNTIYGIYWKGGKSFVNSLYVFIIIYIVIEFLLSTLLLFDFTIEGISFPSFELIMVSISVVIVLISILVWLFPLFKYRPVSDKILNSLNDIIKKSKNDIIKHSKKL